MEMINVTWFFIISLVVISLVKIIIACPPNFLAERLVGKFELHPKLEEKDVIIRIGESQIEGQDKNEVLRSFNEAVFLNRYDLFPKTNGTPLVIETKKGSKDVTFLVYRYNNHVDVFKQYKKSTVAYRLLSDCLQEPSRVEAAY